MKLKETFITHSLEDTQVMVNASNNKHSFHGLVKSNSTAAFIIDQLKENKTKEELIESLLNEYEVDKDTAEKAVTYVIDKLIEIKALED